jgi:hypothetical protein
MAMMLQSWKAKNIQIFVTSKYKMKQKLHQIPARKILPCIGLIELLHKYCPKAEFYIT